MSQPTLHTTSLENGRNSSADLLSIYAPIANAISSVDELLELQIQTGGSILTERLAHSGLSSGKRIRPAFLLLSGACFGDLKKTHIAAAAALELVHAATLVHDDVLDEAQERRHSASLNSRWNNTTSILTGDYLFSKAFEVCCSAGSMETMRRVANSACKVCEGEIIQNAASGNFEVTESQYINMISLKTAALCKCACGLGAFLSECDASTVAQFESYGENLGIAFQIIDDVLDIVGHRERVGKTLGTDLLNKKLTLPVIHCLSKLDATGRASFVNRINQEIAQGAAIQMLSETESIDYARREARRRADSAFEFAASLVDSPFAVSLRQLAEFVIERTY